MNNLSQSKNQWDETFPKKQIYYSKRRFTI